MFADAIVAAIAVAAPISAPAAILDDFRAAWLRADAAALSRLFEEEGRLVIPSGREMAGRAMIAGFYGAVFDAGYRGSRGGGVVRRVTPLRADVVLIEGDWRIEGAKQPNGAARAPESGQFAAIVRCRGGAWRILVLREMRLAS